MDDIRKTPFPPDMNKPFSKSELRDLENLAGILDKFKRGENIVCSEKERERYAMLFNKAIGNDAVNKQMASLLKK